MTVKLKGHTWKADASGWALYDQDGKVVEFEPHGETFDYEDKPGVNPWLLGFVVGSVNTTLWLSIVFGSILWWVSR